MIEKTDMFSKRETLNNICTVPDKIISVYSLEQHIWSGSNSKESRAKRESELQTIEEFQIDPVRPFLNDLFRKISAPYNPSKKDDPIGQGYWIQAEFGSGKSHLLCFLSSLAIGNENAWNIIEDKEKKIGKGKRETLYQFWEGISSKSSNGKRGIFTIAKTLVGVGSGVVGLTDKGNKLSEYILDAAREQMELETGKNLSFYPVELLADRFLKDDLQRYQNDLKKFLKDPNYFEEDEFENIEDFLRDIQENKTPEYKRSCGNKLWRFYTEYLKVQPQIAAETEDILENMVNSILAEGYSGVLIVLDEVSLFMKNRPEELRIDDEKTLVILSNRLAKVKNLPLWLVCAAQQAIESKMGVKNIIADDRLKLVKLLEKEKDYYDIILSRVREIKNVNAIKNYYAYYKRGFTWPINIGEDEFTHFFPFHKPALEVLRSITYELTTTRSAIHFMHQTLKHQIKVKGDQLIRLWELFDEAVRYEEDPSGVHAGLVAIKTKKEMEYKSYEVSKSHIEGVSKGSLKVNRDKAIKVIQTLFLYHIAKLKLQGLSPEEISNEVLIERNVDASPDENIQHYEIIAENLKKELRQIVETKDEDKKPKYKFDPIYSGIDPRIEFQKARDEAESSDLIQKEAWSHLLALGKWEIKTRQMTLDLSSGIESIFVGIAKLTQSGPSGFFGASTDEQISLEWNGKEIYGTVGLRDLNKVAGKESFLSPLDSDQTENDFAIYISTKPTDEAVIKKLFDDYKDPRIIFWTPDELTTEEKDRLLDFAAYKKLVSNWSGKESEDAITIINWVSGSLQNDLGRIKIIVDSSYGRGRMDSISNTKINFRVTGNLLSIISPVVEKILNSVYESSEIKFNPPITFRKEEGVKVINGIVKTGEIPKGAKTNQNISAAKNFGLGLKIIKRGNDNKLDISENRFTKEMWDFINDKLTDETQKMKIETIYKNFSGYGGIKNYGLSKRIIQIYLLCLVREGKIRIFVSGKSGLSVTALDYSNITDQDFTTKSLDYLSEIQKMSAPKNWEVLRPYAEKILNEEIPITNNDSFISDYRKKLREIFKVEKQECLRTYNKSKSLFDLLGLNNPYEEDIKQIVNLFSKELPDGNDIDGILFLLKEAFGYNAFDKSESETLEIDDLANKLNCYKKIISLVKYETELRALYNYLKFEFPNYKEFDEIRKLQNELKTKISNFIEYIDSEIKLKTELLGNIPAQPSEKGTLGKLIKEYTLLYNIAHDKAIECSDNTRKKITQLIESDDFKLLKLMENISVLLPAKSDEFETNISKELNDLFKCENSSKASIEEDLKINPVHSCNFNVLNTEKILNDSNEKIEKTKSDFSSIINNKLEFLLNSTVINKLKQGESEILIKELLNKKDINELKIFLVKKLFKDNKLVDLINKYLKKVKISKISLKEFSPKLKTIEFNQVDDITEEFREFLNKKFNEIERSDDELPIIQID